MVYGRGVALPRAVYQKTDFHDGWIAMLVRSSLRYGTVCMKSSRIDIITVSGDHGHETPNGLGSEGKGAHDEGKVEAVNEANVTPGVRITKAATSA
jgi:hypothetical protein